MNKKDKILIVDDKLENLVALEKILSSFDVEIIRALSGNEALAKTIDHNFALALIDVKMPDMDGYETVKLLRQVNHTMYLPVIFISAIYSENHFLIEGIEAGAIDFITKPIIPRILAGKVKLFLICTIKK
jgi:DNA-binding response OmpR family regulator